MRRYIGQGMEQCQATRETEAAEEKELNSRPRRRRESKLVDITLTDHRLGEGSVLEGGQTEVADLDLAGGARDEDVVALQVPVNNGRVARVQKLEPPQNLTAPLFDDLQGHLLLTEVLQISARKTCVSRCFE